MQETWVQSLSQEDPLEKGMATHSSILAWRIPWIEYVGRLKSMGLHRVGHDWSHWACSTHSHIEGRPCEDTGGWQPPTSLGGGLEQILPSQPSEGTNPTKILILDLLPELWENEFLLFKPSNLWYFYPAAVANWYKAKSQKLQQQVSSQIPLWECTLAHLVFVIPETIEKLLKRLLWSFFSFIVG